MAFPIKKSNGNPPSKPAGKRPAPPMGGLMGAAPPEAGEMGPMEERGPEGGDLAARVDALEQAVAMIMQHLSGGGAGAQAPPPAM